MALCSDLLVIEDDAKIGYPPARVWGVPTTALWACTHRARARQAPAPHRRLALRAPRRSSGASRPRRRRAAELDERFEALLERVARMPINQLVMHKLLRQPGRSTRRASTRRSSWAPFFDGIARHTPEGYAFPQRAAEAGFKRPSASATSRSATSAFS